MDIVNLPGFDRDEAAAYQAAAARLDLFKSRKAAVESAALSLRARIAAKVSAACQETGCPLGKGRDSLPVATAQEFTEAPELTADEESAIASAVAEAA
jgi:hypothetical protein